MNTRRILFPTDFSTTSQACLSHASSLARESGATLVIVHVQEPSRTHGGNELFFAFPDPDRQNLSKMLEEVVPTDSTVPCEHHLVLGDPATEIIRLAKDQGVDLIVMGTHGRTGLNRFIMGSVAETVVRCAKCPVLTLKQGDEDVDTTKSPRESRFSHLGSGI